MFLYEKFDVNNNQIINYQLATKNAYKNLFPVYIPLPIAIGGGIGIIGLIVTLLVMFWWAILLNHQSKILRVYFWTKVYWNSYFPFHINSNHSCGAYHNWQNPNEILIVWKLSEKATNMWIGVIYGRTICQRYSECPKE